ncbi:hypothetical protein DRQ09_01215 [candidate division KSB1 bacterium]|nr:MAG: hypothetical protein DRQ09_01215 [candidate division KSB1 bacterium]
MTFGKTYNTIFILILVCIGLAGIAGYIFSGTEAPPPPFRYYYTIVAGNVMFDHYRHTSGKNVSCSSCHHELISGALEFECSECHENEYSKDQVYQSKITWENGKKLPEKDFSHDDIVEIHKKCTTCHSVDRSIKPKTCNTCHEQGSAKPVLMLCSNCHEEKLNPSDFSHEDLLSIHGSECSGCHQARGKTGLYHLKCITCHADTLPAYFTESGKTRCSACHLK